jgi:Asp/Glu/hydantoin racemase
MRILLVNPNITEAVTSAMADEGRRHASPGTSIVSTTAAFGASYVATRPEAVIAGHAVLDAVASFGEPVDAVVVAAFGDPGLAAAKELFDVPVVGITEAALLTAWTLGRRIGIVCMSPRLATWYRECAEAHGLAARLVGVRSLPAAPVDVSRAREQTRDAMTELCKQVVGSDGAEVVIVGGGPLTGLARDLAGDVDVPLLDGVACAVVLAESLVRLAPRPPARGSYARPPGKATRGLSPALARQIAGGD